MHRVFQLPMFHELVMIYVQNQCLDKHDNEMFISATMAHEWWEEVGFHNVELGKA